MSAALACGRVGHEVVLLEEGSEVCTYFEIQKRILIGVKGQRGWSRNSGGAKHVPLVRS